MSLAVIATGIWLWSQSVTDDDELHEEAPDWDVIRKGQLNMAEMVYCYHQALVASGFDGFQAMNMAASYQWFLMQMSFS